jgi:hypothetical protein
MIEFKINGKEYKIDQITIQNYYDIYTLLALQSTTSQIEIVSKLSGCPINDIKAIDNVNFTMLWTELVNGPLALDNTMPLHKHIAVNGKLYGFTDVKKLTIGELADMDVISKDPRKDQLLHKMMAILYRPAIDITDKWVVVEDYNAETVEERATEFLQMPIAYCFGALNFFLQIKRYSIEAMLACLNPTKEMTSQEMELVELTRQITSELLETGTPLSASSQAEMLLKLTRLQECASTLPLTSSLTQKTKPEKKSLSTKDLWRKLKLSKDKNKNIT